MQLNDLYWSNRYEQHTDAWDAGTITAPIKAFADQYANKGAAVLIPGCGNAHEAVYLLEQGFTNITLIDISTILCQTLRQRLAPYGAAAKVICGDFFEHEGQYELILEQTFFCALDPSLRPQYARHMHALLQPGGQVAGLLFNRQFEGGPPFGGTEAEYRQLFEPLFGKVQLEPCYNSIAPRMGAELFMLLEK